MPGQKFCSWRLAVLCQVGCAMPPARLSAPSLFSAQSPDCLQLSLAAALWMENWGMLLLHLLEPKELDEEEGWRERWEGGMCAEP